MSFSEKCAILFGRIAFGWFFLVQVATYGGDFNGTVAVMAIAHIAGAPFILLVTLLLMTMGALSLIFGYHARYGALILFVITASAAVILHDWWRISDNTILRTTEFQFFICYAAIAGGLLMMVGMGPGPFAIDNRGKGPRK
jgi:putative oxidoreductase